jgi:UDP-N-acetylglucosamine diphosphorylase / glucose-1-phosphate thymidylyltransferase / UDP-N-acetylgalactosamine diphosphorylase / glucosamine-1-phosphate N-acetyltransferase / galactosamine-1-phosphate N-acetyltransferase
MATSTHSRKDLAMRVCLFEDRRVVDLEPLTLTRPAFDLLCGQHTLAVRQRRFFGNLATGMLVRPYLADLSRLAHPDSVVNDSAWSEAGPTIFVNARWLPPAHLSFTGDAPCVGLVGDEVAFALVAAEQAGAMNPSRVEETLEKWKQLFPCQIAGGRLFRYLWEIIDHNADQLLFDWQENPVPSLAEPEVMPAIVGPRHGFHAHPTARFDPMVVVDTTGGPVVVEGDTVITAFTRLEGPCYVGPRTQLFGAKVRAGTSVGPNCRVGGEIEASILVGHVNKYHDGFLGHAYVGEWVNLGAGTQNSDLRNDYDTVRVLVGDKLVVTGRTKVGCFLGDHTKTGLGTLLNTGTNAGAFCNLLPGGLLPRHIPSFTNCQNGELIDHGNLEEALAIAARVMARRGVALTPSHEASYRVLFAETAAARRRAACRVESRMQRAG